MKEEGYVIPHIYKVIVKTRRSVVLWVCWIQSVSTGKNEVYCSKENTSMLYMHVHVACSMCMCMCMLHVMWAVNGHPNLGQRTRSHHDSGHPNTAILT